MVDEPDGLVGEERMGDAGHLEVVETG